MKLRINNERGIVRALFITLLALTIMFTMVACGLADNRESAATSEPAAEESAAEEESAPDGGATGALADVAPAERNGIFTAPPELTIDPTKFYYATIKTSKGDIKLQLFADQAPVTVNNFVYLAREGYYNDTIFHRVIADFMAQAGDPTGTGSGGPGYDFQDEIVPGLGFDRKGLLAMANRGPATNGSQFFITFGPTDWLNGLHTIFGEMIEGEEVLDSITIREPGGADADTILSIEIEESDGSTLPTRPPPPPTPTPTPMPTPYAPTSLDDADRPLADLPAAEKVNIFNVAPEMVIDPEQTYSAIITTSQGEMTVELLAAEAPIAVNNFVVLANLGFFDNTPINQVVPLQFMVIGSPDNNPTSDAGYQFDAEVDAMEAAQGTLAYIPMQGEPGGPPVSNSSQLVIFLVDPPPGSAAGISLFGQITEGIELLETLTGEDTIESVIVEVAE